MIRIEVNIDDTRLTEALEGLAEIGRDATPIMRGLAGIMRRASEKAFDGERDPVTGAAWPDLHPEYKKQRYGAGDSDKVLNRSGRLRQSITVQAGKDYARVGTNMPYAAAHQFGARTSPHVIRARHKNALRIPGIGFRKKVDHPGSVIPTRPFLGVGAEDKEDMRNLLIKNLNKIIYG